MNWIAQWCFERCDSNVECRGCTQRKCLLRERLSEVLGCSEQLLEILQCSSGAVTHPNIADRIADYTGASSDERDTMVAKIHHGTYKPFTVGPPPRDTEPPAPWNIRPVVALDRYGTEIDRFSSRMEACEAVGCSDSTVRNRCIRKSADIDEFELLELTFRFADEWDAMTDSERKIDLGIKEEICEPHEGNYR